MVAGPSIDFLPVRRYVWKTSPYLGNNDVARKKPWFEGDGSRSVERLEPIQPCNMLRCWPHNNANVLGTLLQRHIRLLTLIRGAKKARLNGCKRDHTCLCRHVVKPNHSTSECNIRTGFHFWFPREICLPLYPRCRISYPRINACAERNTRVQREKHFIQAPIADSSLGPILVQLCNKRNSQNFRLLAQRAERAGFYKLTLNKFVRLIRTYLENKRSDFDAIFCNRLGVPYHSPGK